MTEPSYNSCPTCTVLGWDQSTFCPTCLGRGSLPPEKEAAHLEARLDTLETKLATLEAHEDDILKYCEWIKEKLESIKFP
jgi:hypothetical protein